MLKSHSVEHRMKRKHKIVLVIFLIVLFLTAVGYSLYTSKYTLTTTKNTFFYDKLTAPVRIVQLTDLHNSVFGKDNERLAAAVEEQAPDLIVLTGDLINSDEEDCSVVKTLLEKLGRIAPVYVSYGNHEFFYEKIFHKDVKKSFEEAGAKVLEFSYEDVEIRGQKLRLGGLYGYCTPAKYLETKEADERECAFLTEFQATDRLTILLAHMPFAWIVNDGISEWSIDCVFSGHDHGGQIRIPFVGGLYAPDQGFFPGRDCGLYESGDGQKVLVLSRGLGSTRRIPRVFNVPEIVVMDLLPAE